MQQVVRLLGDLGQRYGAEHTYVNLRTPAEAIKLLCINIPELQEELVHAHEHGIGYRLIQADADLGYDDLQLPLGTNDLILTPVVVGSGDSFTNVLIGVGLIAASFLLPGAGIFGATSVFGATAVSGGVLTGLGTAISAIGASLILGGITQMLSPQPQLPNLSANRFSGPTATSTDGPQSIVRGSDGTQSYAYTGAANTVGVGATIPVAYGEVLVGSHLLSANVDVTDDSDPLQTAIRDPGPDTVFFGGEKISYALSDASGVTVARTNKFYTTDLASRKVINQALTLTNGFERELGAVPTDFPAYKDKVDIVFQLSKGLFDYVSGAGTTKVDGYITYRIELTTQVQGPDPVTGTSQGTIQALLLPGQTYRWVHRMSYAPIPDDRDLKFNVEIIDFRAHSSCNLVVHAFGFNLY
jgi:predicted phage tail protein